MEREKKPKEKLVILLDSRESVPYQFGKFGDVIVVRDSLRCGDFSVLPYGDKEVFIERKTLSDLAGSFTAGRERFEREWQRAKDVPCKFLLVEGRFTDMLLEAYRSNMNRNSFVASLLSWSVRYKFNVIFVDGAAEGQHAVYWILKEYVHNRVEGKI